MVCLFVCWAVSTPTVGQSGRPVCILEIACMQKVCGLTWVTSPAILWALPLELSICLPVAS